MLRYLLIAISWFDAYLRNISTITIGVIVVVVVVVRIAAATMRMRTTTTPHFYPKRIPELPLSYFHSIHPFRPTLDKKS